VDVGVAGVAWRDIESLLAACGAEISEGQGSRVPGRPEWRPRVTAKWPELLAPAPHDLILRSDAKHRVSKDGPAGGAVHSGWSVLRDAALRAAPQNEGVLGSYRERGESPEKPFSGQFAVRVDPSLHRKVAGA